MNTTGTEAPERREIATGKLRQRVSGLRPGSRHSPAPQHLVHQRREAEDIGAAVPIGAGDALGRRVRPPHGRRHADALERARHAETGQPNLVLRDEHVAGVKRAMSDVDGGGKIERVRKLARHAQHVGGRTRTIADDDVERVGGDVLLRKIRDNPVDAGGEGRGDARVRESGGNQPLELGDKLMHAFGRQIETEDFDGNQAIAIGFVRTKDRTQSPGTDLMENTKRTERVRRRRAGSVRVQ